MAAKRTSSLIPLCHPLPISHADVKLTAVRDEPELKFWWLGDAAAVDYWGPGQDDPHFEVVWFTRNAMP